MRMSELIKKRETVPTAGRELVESLLKTGPIVHGLYTWTATVNRCGVTTLAQKMTSKRVTRGISEPWRTFDQS